ncbi:MAG TPA: (2Fe-2S)-binding protein [Holophagaceae bacterium]|nr:(2Fe-2S)-binding protein [Holophagaceae bacterium]
MYVCICNALTEKMVQRVISEGAETPDQVFRACGSQRECGRCVPQMEQMIAGFKVLQGCGTCPFRTLDDVAPDVAAAS